MAQSKNARKNRPVKVKYFDASGHPCYPVRIGSKMLWQCDEPNCPRATRWASKHIEGLVEE